MDSYIHSTVTVFQGELLGKCEVYNTLRDMIDIVESYNLEVKYLQTEKKFKLSEQLNQIFISRIKYLEEENKRNERELHKIRTFGKTVREKFLNDILFFLSENRTNQRLKERIMELESLIPEGGLDLTSTGRATEPVANGDGSSAVAEKNVDGDQPQSKSYDLLNQDGQEPNSGNVSVPQLTESAAINASVVPKRNPVFPPLILDLEEKLMLTMFAFLSTGEVLEFAQICRYMYQRVDTIFGINYPLIQPEWRLRDRVIVAPSAELAGTRPPVSNAAATISPSAAPASSAATNTMTLSSLVSSVLSPAKDSASLSSSVNTTASASVVVAGESAANADFRITRELIEPITKKLTVPEIKVIVGLAEKVKKFQLQIETLNAEKEDLGEEKERINAQLFFFMNKLQECEAVLLEFMQKERTLRQQAASDNEVISHLDLQVQQLEGDLLDARQRSGALQASLDLQIGTHSMREEQLQSELNEYKLKYEQLEAKFKNERKLLAKEVKTLRARVESLTVEKTQMSSKLTVLRQALSIDAPSSSTGLHSGASSTHPSPLPPPQSSNQGHGNVPSHHSNYHSNKHHHQHYQNKAPSAAGISGNNGNEPDLSELMAFSRQQSQQQQHQSQGSKQHSRRRGEDDQDNGVNQFW
jgi:hypothetical protein